MSVKLRQWRWSCLPVYNGFTHDERVRGWQAIWWMIDSGRLNAANVCAISGRRERVSLHSENYYKVAHFGISQSLHMSLHQRFKKQDAWRRIVDQYAVTGNEWFVGLSLEPYDLASELRAEHGEGIADIFTNTGIKSEF